MTEPTPNWYALFVRSRHEFVTTEQLRKQGFQVFLPSVNRTRRWSDRNKVVTFPMFPGYVFVHVRPSAEAFLHIVQTRGSVSFVSHEPGRPTIVDPGEMQNLLLLAEGAEDIDIYPHLSEGRTVSVKRGPLKGATGVLLKKDGRNMFLVNINILGRSIGTRVDAEDLELQ